MRLKLIITALLTAILCVPGRSQQLRTEVFDILDLSAPGMKDVRKACNAGKYENAAKALLEYYRSRPSRMEAQSVNSSSSSLGDKTVAELALQHKFYVHEGFLPPFFYGDDIDWKYWPVKDNELRWQLHRMKWLTPMGRIYCKTGDERYPEEWMKQYMDWIAKNPMDDEENARFAWRPLEVSHRVADQINQFILFTGSPSVTPEFLTEFLVNYHRHVKYLTEHFSEKGNHLLFQAVRTFHAGAFFPEFKDAKGWRDTGISILNKQIGIQVYEDGCQFELCPHYHLACIDIFVNALDIAQACGFTDAFPQSYKDKVEKMVEFYANICFPDYENPCFSDAKISPKDYVLPKYRKWSGIWPGNTFIKSKAEEKLNEPGYLCKGFLKSGYFVFRNSWGDDATQMVVKAGPPGEWHCQPDNGTFELWHKGRRIFQDSGFYTYAGGPEIMEWRNWFRQSCVHNTLTLDYRNFENTDSHTLLWEPDGETPALVTEIESYKGLRHRRSIFFMNHKWFLIVDEASGEAEGTLNLNFQMPQDESGFTLTCSSPNGECILKEEQGWMSEHYLSKVSRKHLSYNISKKSGETIRFITAIIPND